MKKNILYNLFGSGLPAIVALYTIPETIRVLGTEAFGGVLLVWAVVGYFGLLDFGIGRAITFKISQYLKLNISGDECLALNQYTWTGIVFVICIGLIVSLILVIVAFTVYNGNQSLIYVAAGVPILMVGTAARGILEAFSDFKLINLVRLPIGLYLYAAPLVVALYISKEIEAITVALLVGRILSTLILLYFAINKIRSVGIFFAVKLSALREMIKFGGWLTVSNMSMPLIAYVDRFIITSTLGLSYVSYYVTPQEIISKLSFIPGAIVSVVFPNLVRSFHLSDNDRFESSLRKSIVYLLIVYLPVVLTLLVYSDLVLEKWLGIEFVKQSSLYFKVFIIGFFINHMSHLPYTAIQSTGNVRALAIVHLFILFAYAVSLIVLVYTYALDGAIAAWIIKVTLEILCIGFLYNKYLGRNKKVI